ncbi:MAG: hypothetical protein E6Q27_09295 [Aeromicrobium sp.]|nr:MAG: hypothetical protein E6Q27_09295 [Aeromicrobium sp.]
MPGLERLNNGLTQSTETAVAEFRRDYVSESGTAVADPELNISWETVGSSKDALGILMHEYFNAGASVSESWYTTWVDPNTGVLHPNRDLVKDPADLNDAVREALRGSEGIDTELLNTTLAKGVPVLAFTKYGDLFAAFDEYQIAAGSYGRITVTLPASQSDEMLSPFGAAAKKAALDPSTPEFVATEPTRTVKPHPSAETVDCAKLKCVALTYDDGPGGHTNRLLDTLKKKHARVTFFALGQQIEMFPKVAARTVAEGHEYGIHTWSHKQLTALSPPQVRKELSRAVLEAERITGIRPTLYRPPYGASNERIRKEAKALGLAEILWSIDTLDWKDRNTDLIVQRVLDQTRRNSIVLMHDIHPTTVAATPRIIDGLQDRGFTLVTVTELLGNPKPGVKYR